MGNAFAAKGFSFSLFFYGQNRLALTPSASPSFAAFIEFRNLTIPIQKQPTLLAG
jgi:hypothetical protein